jgi:glycosyltransferase involved in cell wall biosynthesis
MAGRVALYMPSFSGGGAEYVMVMLANAFAARQIDVDLVVADAAGEHRDKVSSAVRIVDLKARRVVLSLLPLMRYLRRERPRAMLSFLNHANVVAVVARGLAGARARLVISERNHLSSDYSLAGGLRGRLLLQLMRLTYPRADRVISVSNGVAQDLVARLGLPARHVETIYNPIVSSDLRSLAAKPLDHSWFKPGAPPVVLGVGRLSRQKDFATLIRAFAKVRSERVARLMILGDGEKRMELEAMIEAEGVAVDVSMPGFASNPLPHMQRSAVFVLSSLYEGLPGVLIQAMACGTAVVSTDCPSGPAEILENGRWGRLVPVGDAGAMARSIMAALDDEMPPDVSARAAAFGVEAAVCAYLKALSVIEDES